MSSETRYLNLYFQVHQPFRMRRYMVFDIGASKNYFDAQKNREIMQRVEALTEKMRAQDALVWTNGLEFAGAARVVTAGDPPLITEGPYLETRESIGGFWIIRAETAEAAHDWAAQASRLPGWGG